MDIDIDRFQCSEAVGQARKSFCQRSCLCLCPANPHRWTSLGTLLLTNRTPAAIATRSKSTWAANCGRPQGLQFRHTAGHLRLGMRSGAFLHVISAMDGSLQLPKRTVALSTKPSATLRPNMQWASRNLWSPGVSESQDPPWSPESHIDAACSVSLVASNRIAWAMRGPAVMRQWGSLHLHLTEHRLLRKQGRHFGNWLRYPQKMVHWVLRFLAPLCCGKINDSVRLCVEACQYNCERISEMATRYWRTASQCPWLLFRNLPRSLA